MIRSASNYAQGHPIRKKKNTRIAFTITTNGTLLEEEHLQFFQENNCRYLLSLDGANETNNTYRKMRNGKSQYEILRKKMTMLKSFQPWQGARVTVMPQTARQLAENIETLHRDLKINQFVIGFATGIEWSEEQIADYCFSLKEVFEFLLQERINNETPRLRIALMKRTVVSPYPFTVPPSVLQPQVVPQADIQPRNLIGSLPEPVLPQNPTNVKPPDFSTLRKMTVAEPAKKFVPPTKVEVES